MAMGFKKTNLNEAAENVDLNGDGDKLDTVVGWKNFGSSHDRTNDFWE
jgi:hypothetical protein